MRFLYLFIAILISNVAFSQDYEVTHYTVEDGLMSNLPYGIYEDSLNRIWVPNGRGFTIFFGDHVENVKGIETTYILNHLPVLTSENFYQWGNFIFNDYEVTCFNQLEGLSHSVFDGLDNWHMSSTSEPIYDKNGFRWIFNREDSLALAYNKEDTIDLNPILNKQNINFNDTSDYFRNFVLDNKGNAWFKSSNNDIYSYNISKQKFSKLSEKIPDISGLYFQNDSNYIASGDNLKSNSEGIYIVENWESKYIGGSGKTLLITADSSSTIYADQEGLKIYKDSVYIIYKLKFISDFGSLNGTVINTKDFILFSIDTGNEAHLYKYLKSSSKLILIHKDQSIRNLHFSTMGQIWYTNDDGATSLSPSDIKEVKFSFFQKDERAKLICSNPKEDIDYFAGNIPFNIAKDKPTSLYYLDSTNKFTLIDNGYYEPLQGKNARVDCRGFLFKKYSKHYAIDKDMRTGKIVPFDGETWICELKNKKIDSIISISRIEQTLKKKISVKSLQKYKDKTFLFCRNGIVKVNTKLECTWQNLPKLKYNHAYRNYDYRLSDEFQLIRFAADSINVAVIFTYDFVTEKFKEILPNLNASKKYNLKNGSYYSNSKNRIIQVAYKQIAIVKDTSYISINGESRNLQEFSLITDEVVLQDSVLIALCRNNGLIILNINTLKLVSYKEYRPYYKIGINGSEVWMNSFYENIVLNLDSLAKFKISEQSYLSAREGFKYGEMIFKEGYVRFCSNIGYVEKNFKDKGKLFRANPNIYFHKLRLNYEDFNWSNTTSRVDTFSGNIMPYNLQLNHDKNHLTFDYQGVSHSNKNPLLYFHQLVGQDTNFVGTKSKSATYSNLEPGNYTFKVFAQDEHDRKSRIIECSFTISHPFWETWWFIGLCILGIGGILYSGYNYNVKRLKARQEELESEVEQATAEIREQKEELQHQKDEVEEAHREITDSINYAERIQRSFLATDALLNENLNEYFVYFNPKEAVSGDFYWAGKLANGNFGLVNADSTGHGVPGAIMSILNISSIEKAVDKGLTQPSEIFNETRKTIIDRLKNDGSSEGGKDGMDASLIAFNSDKTKMHYVAAQNPIWIIRNGDLTEIKPEKMPVGKHDNDHVPFVGGEYDIQKGDVIYTLTDGFQDQFGGAKGKKFMVKKMREYVHTISHLPMKEQHEKISETFLNWKGNLEQIDDVCVIGICI